MHIVELPRARVARRDLERGVTKPDGRGGRTVRMRGSDFVFRYRFWLFAATFFGGFALSGIDHVNATVAVLHTIAPSLDVDTPRGMIALRAAFAVGAVSVTLAALLRTWATAYLHATVVHDDRLHTEALVASGPYRYVRNPLYLGGLLLAAGLAPLASRTGALVILAGVVAITLALIDVEERELTSAQGASYASYRRAVPRLVPALSPRVAPSGLAPHWGQAFLGEGMFWGFAIAMIVFVITLQPTWTAVLLTTVPILHLALMSVWRRRR